MNGDYQGTVFRFTNVTDTTGINRLAWGPEDAVETRAVSCVQASEDGKRVYLKINGLKAMDYVVAFKLTGVKPAGGTRTLWEN